MTTICFRQDYYNTKTKLLWQLSKRRKYYSPLNAVHAMFMVLTQSGIKIFWSVIMEKENNFPT